MGEEGVEIIYPDVRFERDLLIVDGERVMKVTMLTNVVTMGGVFFQVRVEGFYPAEDDVDVDAEVEISEQFHEKCLSIFYGEESSEEENERFV